MDTQTTEQALRREAVRRRLQGERRCDIGTDLNRSPAWFSKWWAEYHQNPLTDLADQLRAQALGCAGDPNARTPHLDRLASQGVMLATAVSNCPVCSPYFSR